MPYYPPAPAIAATQAEMESATSTSVYVSPGRQKFHPGACKAWAVIDGTGTLSDVAGYNVDATTDNGTGDYTINITTDLSSANYLAVVTGDVTVGSNTSPVMGNITTQAAGSLRVLMSTSASTPDCDLVFALIFGDI